MIDKLVDLVSNRLVDKFVKKKKVNNGTRSTEDRVVYSDRQYRVLDKMVDRVIDKMLNTRTDRMSVEEIMIDGMVEILTEW